MSLSPQHVIATVHGIRTSSDSWQQRFAAFAAGRYCDRVVTAEIMWGWISGIQMYLLHWVPFWERKRRKAVATILARLLEEFPFSSLSVLAHSKGTDLVVDTLLANRDLRIATLILVGAVLKEHYHRTSLPILVGRGQVARVLNVWSPNDHTIRDWSFGPYGKAGWKGFVGLRDNDPVWQQKTEEAHATYFWSEFREKHFARWIEFATDDGKGKLAEWSAAKVKGLIE